MEIYYSPRFEREYKKIPKLIKLEAEKAETLFRKDPFDQNLKTHKLHGKLKEFWSFGINNKHRIVFEFVSENIVWFHSIGDHSVYD